MTTLGFLGLGSMGSAMATQLVNAGHDVLVWNRSKDPIGPLVEAGAREARTPEEALGTEFSFSMLANDAAADAVLSADAVTAAKGNTHVSMASISTSLADTLSERFTDAGATYLSGPVVGRPDVAAAGKLNFLVAGPAIDTVEPYLLAMGVRVWQLGDRPAIANAVKAVVNYNIIHALQALGESIAMTERLGVSPDLFTDLLSNTLFGGAAHTGYGKMIAERKYTPAGFQMPLGRKDLGLVQQVAESVDFAPATLPTLIDIVETALDDPELAEYDWSAIAEVSRRSKT